MKIDYPKFDDWVWKSHLNKIIDPTEFINDHIDHMFFIGTDSQNYGRKRSKPSRCIFTSVIIAYKRGRGGISITSTNKTEYIRSLRQRLMIEVMRSLECAWFLDKFVDEDSAVKICKPEIHMDVNIDPKHKSSLYRQELVGIVTAQGFEAVCKPNAWAASIIADRFC